MTGVQKRESANSIETILRRALHRKQISRPDYSLRALARDLDVSASFVSNLLSGKKNLPLDRLEKLTHLLELDIHERDQLMQAMVEHQLDSAPAELKRRLRRRDEVDTTKPLDGREVQTTARTSTHSNDPGEGALSNWYNLAVLESLGGLKEELRDLADIQERLHLSESQMQKALRDLTEAGLLEKTEDGYHKVAQHTYFASGRSKAEVRRFHAQMIERAKLEFSKTSDADFHRRLISGFTFTLDETRVEELKMKLVHFLDEFSKSATTDEGTDVYQCNFQFFPLTEKLKP